MDLPVRFLSRSLAVYRSPTLSKHDESFEFVDRVADSNNNEDGKGVDAGGGENPEVVILENPESPGISGDMDLVPEINEPLYRSSSESSVVTSEESGSDFDDAYRFLVCK